MSRRKVALELGYKSTLYLVRIEPKPVFVPSIRRRPARPVPVEAVPAERPASPPRELTMRTQQLSPSSPNILQPARPAVFNFRFSADRRFKEKFERLAEVMGVENSQRLMAEILEQALDVALDKKDPKRKLERRTARQKATKAQPRPDEMSEDVAPGVPRVKDQPARSRYILSETERVHARGEHQCEYKSVDGRRCRSRTGLQVDHERPFAREQKANSRSPATALGRLFYFQDLDVLGLPNHEKQPMAVLLDLRQDLHLLSYVAILQIALGSFADNRSG